MREHHDKGETTKHLEANRVTLTSSVKVHPFPAHIIFFFFFLFRGRTQQHTVHHRRVKRQVVEGFKQINMQLSPKNPNLGEQTCKMIKTTHVGRN